MSTGEGDSSSSSGSSTSEDEGPRTTHRDLARRDKGKGRDLSIGKRKRTETADGERSARRRTAADDDDDDDDDADSDVFDPDQPMDERREIQRKLRELQKGINENMEEFMMPGSTGLKDTLMRAQEVARGVKQTTEATIDSRLLVSAVDLSYRKTVRLMQGGSTEGVDVDEFVSKCCTYMRQAAGIAGDEAPELSHTQRRRRRTTGGVGGGDDEGDDEAFNWSHLGRFASLPNIRRPALPGFLLGPLSVEKKVRKISKRSAPFRPNNLAETRPEVLDVEDLAKKENDLTAICSKIFKQLQDIQSNAQTELYEIFESKEMSEEEQVALMLKYGLRDTGGVDLLRFVVNPKSFGQTVENMFYVSFLIRDGKIGIEFDSNELPSLKPIEGNEPDEEGGARREKAKQQAIFSMDMKTWQDIIDAFDIQEPMIKHRKEAATQGPGARGWYS
ncbi:Non-structural maintenance of chromosome element 4 [Colletotrichum orbiculare MAFF 240422]|uniref:Non-structural maintenance of chromosomes element 4 n=1 Tax=Colletotrichum orbiculare (strain 104-T / ATCC 96160 / CBS 514.97 / LARS 414 / MAFF 240422) TaxID=1213857 RepID=N4V5Y7_COLOR|nr:Non-structural maintenance of chromosome element 4 [Colletotrichum orbiculare MAFF 240422]